MFLTMPSVNFPDRWSDFNTTRTRCPGLMSTRSVMLILSIFQLFKFSSWITRGWIFNFQEYKRLGKTILLDGSTQPIVIRIR
jgi:hypothetical protein